MVFGFQMEVNNVPLLKRDASINLAVSVVGLPLVFKIQILTFLTIIVTTLSQVLSSRLMRANRPAIANRLDTIAGITIFAAYSGEVLWLLLAATAMA